MPDTFLCPHCKAPFQVNKTLPVGVQVLCPGCKNLFEIPANALAANGIVAGAVRAASMSSASAHTLDLPRAYAAASAADAGSEIRNASPTFLSTVHGRLLVVLSSGVLFAILGVGLAIWCYSGPAAEKPKILPIDEGPSQVSVQPPRVKPTPASERPKSDEEKQVEKMVRQGVEFLLKTQNKDGTWPHDSWGPMLAAMGGLTLLECGVPATHPAVQNAAKFCRDNWQGMSQTYGVSLYVLFFDKLNDSRDEAIIHHLAMRLVATQDLNGSWFYTTVSLDEHVAKELAQTLRDMKNKTWKEFSAADPKRAQKVSPNLQALPVFQFDPNPNDPAIFFKSGGCNSNTQFAMLALWAARRHKLPVDHSLAMGVRRFRASQEDNGKWIYMLTQPIASPGEAFTCAGLLFLTMGYALDVPVNNPAKNPMEDPAIKKALAFLGNSIGSPRKDRSAGSAKPPQVGTYFLWSVERVGVLFKLPKIGDKDWYRWGVDMLGAYQNDDGSWHFDQAIGPTCPASDTCFALLFLHQANLNYDLTDKLEKMMALQANAAKTGKKD